MGLFMACDEKEWVSAECGGEDRAPRPRWDDDVEVRVLCLCCFIASFAS